MKNLPSALSYYAKQTPESTAILIKQKDGEWTTLNWRLLNRQVERWAATFHQQRLEPGSLVFIVLRHCDVLYSAFLGAMRAGLVPSFLPYPTPKQDPERYWAAHAALFQRSHPACVLTYTENLDGVRRLLKGANCRLLDSADCQAHSDVPLNTLPPIEQIERDARVALVQHSSGTTGSKKGVALTYGQIRLQLQAYARKLEASALDCIISWLPLYHDMGLISGFLLPLTLGSKVVSIDAFDWLARPDELFGLIEEHRANLCWLPNFAFNHLVRTRSRTRNYDLSSVRAFINCSEPCKAETFDLFRHAFEPHGLQPFALQSCYAMAEAVFAVSQTSMAEAPTTVAVDQHELAARGIAVVVDYQHERAQRFLSCGRPIEGVELRIVVEEGRNVGEIQIRGDFIFDQYYLNPEATLSAFSEGWYYTGD